MAFLLGALLAVVAGLIFWTSRARDAAQAGRAAAEAVGDAASALRRFGFRRKANVNPLDAEEDPRLAAVAAMASVARMEGERSAEQSAYLAETAERLFQSPPEEARDMASYGFWLSAQAEPEEALRRLQRNLARRLDDAEWLEFSAALRGAAELDGPATDRQKAALARLAALRTPSRNLGEKGGA